MNGSLALSAANQIPKRKVEFSNQGRNAILQFLLPRSINRKLRRGALDETATEFNCNRVTVWRIWKRALRSYAEGNRCADVDSRKKNNCGRKRKNYSQNIQRIRDVPFNKRSNLRSLACSIGVPKSTLFRIFKRGDTIKRVSSTVKPYLTDENKIARVKFCLSKIGADEHFKDLFDSVHIDEKWFYLTQVNRSYYLCLDEEVPHRTCKSKRFITKVMFMAAVARPRFDANNNCTFDGKIGIWPFTTQAAAQRKIKNRAKGTIETKNIESVNKDEVKKMMIEKLFPAIKQKWPLEGKTRPIYVQQDNAKPHVVSYDRDIVREGSSDGWQIEMQPQPPNIPDVNVLDLGFFNSIQSLQHQASPNNIDELITAVINAFNAETPETLNNVFLSHQQVMECIMTNNGSNRFKLPHMKKDHLRRNGLLPVSLKCSQQLIESCQSNVDGVLNKDED